MPEYHLIVSNPPHRSSDPIAVAPHLNCSAAEVRMKLNFPAPEVWLAEADKGAAGVSAKALLEAGASVVWIPGAVLAAVPRAAIGSEILIDNGRVVITTGVEDLVINANDRVVAVLGEPVQQAARPLSDSRPMLSQTVSGRAPVKSMPIVSGMATGVGGATGSKALGKLDQVATDAKDAAGTRVSEAQFAEPTERFLDIYALSGSGWRSARLAPSYTDFSGLGSLKQPMGRANIGCIVDVLKKDFGARVDERLVKVTYKPSIVSGVALNQILGTISERLVDIPLLDIGSQLAFLTSKGKGD